MKKLFLIGIALSFFSLVGCNEKLAKENVENYSFKNEVEINTHSDVEEIESLQTRVQFLEEQNHYLVSAINKVIGKLSDEDMLAFSKDQFLYELDINDEPIPKNGLVTVEAEKIEILLSEKILGFDFLSAEWLDKGRINGEYSDHLVNIDAEIWVSTGYDGTVNTARGYQSEDLKSGEQISFNITEELRERLEIDTTLIQIKVKWIPRLKKRAGLKSRCSYGLKGYSNFDKKYAVGTEYYVDIYLINGM